MNAAKVPTGPGFFWFRDPGDDWRIIKVKRRGADELIYITEAKRGINIRCLQGEWGGRVLTPEETSTAVHGISTSLFSDIDGTEAARLVISKEGEDKGRTGWGKKPVEDLIHRYLRGDLG